MIQDKYMEETLDSLSAQSIVNDIEIIDQTKPGQITRGDEVLNKAEGKYLYFMNSGDLLTSFALEELWNICETKHLDILLFSGAVFYENTKLAKRYKNLSDEFLQMRLLRAGNNRERNAKSAEKNRIYYRPYPCRF